MLVASRVAVEIGHALQCMINVAKDLEAQLLGLPPASTPIASSRSRQRSILPFVLAIFLSRKTIS